jgi:hypothetical protein|tara:strand:- start:14329 stop:16743 length:2415 start_codon:yes stop_codon:yes gene_type:complete
MAEQPIPFAEGAPPDDLKVEQIGNNEVLIGDPELDIKQDIDTEFDANLAEDINDKELKRKATQLLRIHEEDREARSDWEERYKAGLRTVDPDGGMSEEEDARASRGLSTVVHPMIAEAATQFNARAIAELYPSGGPVKTVIVGEATEETEDQARRVKDFMNYQITQDMPEYFPDFDKMLFQLPLVGHAFKKVWWDANLERQCSRFVKAEDFVVAPESTDLYTSQRYTHVIRMARNDFLKYVEAGWYLESEYSGDGIDPSGDTTEDIEGIDPYSQSDETMTLLEMHVYESFDGVDGYDDTVDDDNVVGLPYVITIDPDSEKVVSVRRNWDPEDPKMKRLDWFVSYPFLPGVGFYGFGLYHLIGGLGKAATGSLRALLDSAAFANMQGGFKLKGRVTGGELQINPGEFADLDATVDDVNKAIMPLPFKEPSGALFNLLGFITDAGKRFANTSDMNVGDVNPNAPVGTTVALIEQGSKSFSAIHKRLHYAQGQEFKLLAKLNAKYLPENMDFALAGASQTIYAKDFDERIDIIPVSDPNIFSTAQRIAQAQSIMTMANAAPQLHDIYEAYKRMYEAIRIPNIDEVLKKPQEAVRLDPIDENMSLMYGKPIRAFPEQDHDAHIAVHIQFMQDPSLAGNPASKGMQPLLIAHIAEHVALLYRQRMQASIGVDLPTIPNLKDPRFSFDDISPEMDMIISQRAAQVVEQSPQMEAIKPIAAMAKQNPLQYAQQLAKLEMEGLKARTQQQLAADQAKAQNQMSIEAAKARQDLEIEAAKTRADLEAKIAKLEADLRLEREKVLQKEIIKGGA